MILVEVCLHLILRGSDMLIGCVVLPPAQRDFLFGHKAHAEHSETTHGRGGGVHFSGDSVSSHDHGEKTEIEHKA